MIGVVLAGGASRRFGGRAKGLHPIEGRAMALRVADVLATFCDRVAIEAAPGAGYEALGLPLVHAAGEHAGRGPLAGLAAGLGAAEAGERVAFGPCDMPLLTRAIYDALAAAEAPGAYALTQAGAEPLVAVLDAALRPALLAALAAEEVARTHAVLAAAGARGLAFDDPAPFANVNAPADLERLSPRRPPSSRSQKQM